MSEPPFAQVGAYELVRRLGAGGMGEVYLARDARLERLVALKLLPAEFSRDPAALARFRREALTLAALNHPNIATIHGFEDTPDGGLALVLEFVEGESLAARLARGALPVPEALAVCAQVAEALEVAHARGVVHRDLKPGNVMLAPRGLVKVLDFGLAKRAPGLAHLDAVWPGGAAEPARGAAAPPSAAAPPGEGPSTHSGAIAGTPGYMSPEQVLAGEQDARTDVFAFACVLYECLSGRRAFTGRNDWEVLAKVLHETPDAEALPERLPVRVRDLLDRCFEKDAAERPRDMRAVRLEIEEALGVRRASALRAGEEAGTPHNLPHALTSFVGRERELARAGVALAGARLLTLLGMGGSGKTRLAIRLAEAALEEHPDGVWFVDLGALDDQPGRVAEAVAGAVGAREEPGTPIVTTLVTHLRERRALLLLDNCEDVLAGCRDLVARLLAACGALRVLATSRAALGVRGEVVHAVPPFEVPAGAGDPAANEAVRLFAERAIQARPDFALTPASAPVVAEICRRLDGIPLALELAAARVRVLGVDQILARLGDRFRLLTASGAGVDARQQTLRAVIQWSADPLTAEEARLFQAFSVFRGSWSLESGVAVSGPDADEFAVLDALQRLAERSLVVPGRDAAGDARYRYLESVRQFAAEGLAAAGAAGSARDRHLAWFLGLAERAQGGLVGPDQRAWSARLDLEHEDVLAAYAWSGGRPGGVEKGLRIAAAMSRYWSARGHYGLARRTLGDALTRPEGGAPVAASAAAGADPSVRATALVRAAGFALYEGDTGAARAQLEDALGLYRAAGDAAGVARALTGLATEAVYRRDYDRARACYEETLAAYRAARNPHATAIALHNLGYIALLEGDPAAARTRYEEAVHLFEGTGDDRHLGHTLGELGRACARLGDVVEARARIAAALRLARDLGAQSEGAYGLEGAAELAAARGETGLAIAWLETALALRERLGITVVPAEREQQETFRSRLRERLGAAEAQRAAASGRGQPFEEAVGASLAWLEDPVTGG